MNFAESGFNPTGIHEILLTTGVALILLSTFVYTPLLILRRHYQPIKSRHWVLLLIIGLIEPIIALYYYVGLAKPCLVQLFFIPIVNVSIAPYVIRMYRLVFIFHANLSKLYEDDWIGQGKRTLERFSFSLFRVRCWMLSALTHGWE